MENGFSNGHFYSVSQFYREKFGSKVYKIAIDAGCTCPNRDGTKGRGGCVFCSESGSGEFSADKNLSISEQIKNAKNLVSQKIKNGKYIAYFQSHSNTYGDEEELFRKYLEAVSQEDVVGLSIATRPDCIFPSMLEKISALSKRTFVTVELGLQTSNEKSADYIKRLYTNEDYLDCVRRIKKSSPDIHVVTHLIFGLPFETEMDMLESVDFCVRAGTDGIKICVLHVLEGTELLNDFKDGKFSTLEMEEYFKILGKALKRIPENVVIHRLTGDGAKRLLVSPMWTADKKNVLNSLASYLRKNEIVQGKDFQYNFLHETTL